MDLDEDEAGATMAGGATTSGEKTLGAVADASGGGDPQTKSVRMAQGGDGEWPLLCRKQASCVARGSH